MGTSPPDGNMDIVLSAHSCHWAGRSPGHSSSRRNRWSHTARLWTSCPNTPVDMHHPVPHTQLLSCTPCPPDTHLRGEGVEVNLTCTHKLTLLIIIIKNNYIHSSIRKHQAAPEQGWELQSLVCICGPGQLLPPCCGVGELQNRSLIWTPESHSDEHWDHGDQDDQPPFTGST